MNNSTIVLPLSQPEFKPYLLQALLDWSEAQGYTPYMLVKVDDYTEVPRDFLNSDGTIVFCVSSEATNKFCIEDDHVSFQARFGDRVQNIWIPMGRIAAVYPKENTDLVSYFPVLETTEPKSEAKRETPADSDEPVFTKI